ncbi:MAG: hypothetical protein U9R08_03980 [Nanoarchaeota archaeon]|nr:hypothetical protein [Nanoarchaeota archaeon]
MDISNIVGALASLYAIGSNIAAYSDVMEWSFANNQPDPAYYEATVKQESEKGIGSRIKKYITTPGRYFAYWRLKD